MKKLNIRVSKAQIPYLTIGQLNELKSYAKEFNENTYDNGRDGFEDDLQRAADFYAGENCTKILCYTAEHVMHLLDPKTSVSMTVEGSQKFVKVTFYIQDFWELAGESNRNEIMSHAYIRRYELA